jgi:cytochrome c5
MKTIITAALFVAGILSSSFAAAQGDAAAGEAVFNRVCKMCHGSGVMGAPKVGDKKDWEPRVAQGQATLTEHAIKGFKKMPARGNCRSCSDQEIADGVAYMLSRVK